MVRIGLHEVAGMHIGTGVPSAPAPAPSAPQGQGPKPVAQTPQMPQGPLGPTIPPQMGPPITQGGGS